jgi:hypothetical protein
MMKFFFHLHLLGAGFNKKLFLLLDFVFVVSNSIVHPRTGGEGPSGGT